MKDEITRFDEWRAEKNRVCVGCRWYAEFEGVCTNTESEYCADYRYDGCEKWDKIPLGFADNGDEIEAQLREMAERETECEKCNACANGGGCKK